MMTTVQKWLMGMVALGAAYLAFTNSAGVYKVAQAGTKLIGGSETQIITGGKAGG
jgi:hypothetical protein